VPGGVIPHEGLRVAKQFSPLVNPRQQQALERASGTSASSLHRGLARLLLAAVENSRLACRLTATGTYLPDQTPDSRQRMFFLS
jgi:hypothetical protein